MADSKISQLSELAVSSIVNGDWGVVVDVSDTSMAATGTTKKFNLANLAGPYEYGSWSPTIYGSTTPGSPTFSPAGAQYVRIGRYCFIKGYITMSNKGTMAGNVMIGGLPFVVSGSQSAPIWWPYQLATGIVQLAIDLASGQTYGGLLRSTAAVASGNTPMPVSDLNNNSHLQFSFGYICQ